MKHCTRCRADAIGLLDDDRSSEFRELPVRLFRCLIPLVPTASLQTWRLQRWRDARQCASWRGGAHFQYGDFSEDGYSLVEERRAPEKGSGVNRWYALAEVLSDCRAILVSGIGEVPAGEVLAENEFSRSR